MIFILYFVLLQGLSIEAITRHKRIVNGIDVRLGELPFQVSIQNIESNYHHCGGIIINRDYVLTAAHCLDGFLPEEFQIVSGTLNLNNPRSINYGSEIHIHEDYSLHDSWKNDIALIKVTPAFRFNNFISPAVLPKSNEDVPINVKALVSGFGRTSKQSFTSRLLKKTEIEIREISYCNERYKTSKLHFRDTQVCAYNEADSGICKGDSGGPIILRNKVIGISSFTNEGCADAKFPSVFTKISSYIKWIQKYTTL